MVEAPALHTGFDTVYPHRRRETGRKILDLLVDQGGIYVPEECSVWKEEESFETRKFSQDIIEILLDEWEGHRGPLPGFHLTRWKPFQTSLIASQTDFGPYDDLIFHVQKAYLLQKGKVAEFVEFSRKLYNILGSAFGDIGSMEMRRKMKRGSAEFFPGMDLLKQGLPDLNWATFLGPEYVELFGSEKVHSAPCYRVESLADGGALLLLTESPFDFDKDQPAFNWKRDSLKAYLGLDAFYINDEHRATRYPKFRFWEERQTLIRKYQSKARTLRPLTPQEVRDQEDWIANLRRTSNSFGTRAQSQGYALEYSENGLSRLEDYLSSVLVKVKGEREFERDAGAYLGLTLQKLFEGQWTIDHFFRTPALDLPRPGASPGKEKSVSEGEMKLSFEPGLGDAPDAIAFDKTVRTWPISQIHRFIRSGAQKGLLGYYVDAIRKALGRTETGIIRIQT